MITKAEYNESKRREQAIKDKMDELFLLIDTFQADNDKLAAMLETERVIQFKYTAGQFILTPAAVRMEFC